MTDTLDAISRELPTTRGALLALENRPNSMNYRLERLEGVTENPHQAE